MMLGSLDLMDLMSV